MQLESKSSIKVKPDSTMQATCSLRIFLLVTGIFAMVNSIKVTYTDLVTANKTCAPKDTCERGKSDRLGDGRDWRSRNCFCDDHCALYADCCVDAHRFPSPTSWQTRFNCVPLRQFGQIYMQAECPQEWQDSKIRQMCKAALLERSSRDVISRLPVTSLATGITYRSIHCAVCNGETSEKKLRFWHPRIECMDFKSTTSPINPMVVAQKLTFSEGNATWTLQQEDGSWTTCSIDPSLPATLSDIVRPCLDVVRSCPSNWTDNEVRDKCAAYTGVVYHLNERYRNVHCAMCNGIEPHSLSCSQHLMPRFNFVNEFNPVAFAILLDVDFGSSTAVGEEHLCEPNQLYDPFFQKCRSVTCVQEGWVYHEGNCIPAVSTRAPETSDNIFTTQDSSWNGPDFVSVNPENATNPSDLLSNNDTMSDLEFISCPKFLLDVDEYTLESNGTVAHVPAYGKQFPQDHFLIQSDGRLVVCAVGLTVKSKFGSLMGYISFIGLGISVICLLLHLVAFLFIHELRNLSGKNLASLCVALLAGYNCFLAGQWVEPPGAACVSLAVLAYYSFLSAFCWMFVMSFDVWQTLRRSSTELRVNNGAQRVRFFTYSLIGWVIPAVVVASAVLVDLLYTHDVPHYIRPQFGRHFCWFGQRTALLLFFAVPLCLTMLCNLGFFIDSARVLINASRGLAKPVSCCPTRRNFRLYVRMALIMGLTWISGLVAASTDLMPLWYLFIFFNTLQGVFIFAVFTCTRKVAKAIRVRFRVKASHGSSGSSWSAASGSNTPIKSSRLSPAIHNDVPKGIKNSPRTASTFTSSPVPS